MLLSEERESSSAVEELAQVKSRKTSLVASRREGEHRSDGDRGSARRPAFAPVLDESPVPVH